MTLIKRTTRNISWMMVSDLLAKGVTVFTTLYLARVLGVEHFGYYSLGVAISTAVWPVVDLGSIGFGMREVARDRSKASNLVKAFNSSRLIAAIIAILITVAATTFFKAPEIKKWTIIVSMLYLAGYAISVDWVFMGLEKINLVAIVNVAVSISFVACIFFLVKSPEFTVSAALYRSLTFMFGSVLGIILLKKRLKISFMPSIDVALWLSNFKERLYFCLNRLMANVSRFAPLYLVSLLLTDNALGLFSAPHRVFEIALGAIAIIPMSVFPIISGLYAKDIDEFKVYHQQLVRFVMHVSIPLAFIAASMPKQMMGLLFGQNFVGASLAFSLLVWTVPLVGLRTIYGLALLSSRFEQRAFLATLFGIGLEVIFALLFISRYGIAAAAASLLVGEIASLIFMVAICSRTLFKWNPFDAFFLKVCMASAIVSLGLVFFKTGNVIIASMLGILGYILLAFLLKIFPKTLLIKAASTVF